MKWKDIPEISEIENEMEYFLEQISKSNDREEIEMYRQMIKVNIAVLKYLLHR